MRGVVTPTELRDAARPLEELLAELDPDFVTSREAPGLWEALESIRRRVSGAQVLLARLVDESSVAKNAGLRNGAEWIAMMSGESPTSGHGQVATSRRLTKLDRTSAALRRGDISVRQADAIADAASCDPSIEERLLTLAGTASLGELRKECLRVKAAADPDPEKTYERIHRERRLRQQVDDEGAWCLSGRGTVDAGSEFATVLGAIADEIFQEAHANGTRDSADCYRFDALIEMARRAWRDMHADEMPDLEIPEPDPTPPATADTETDAQAPADGEPTEPRSDQSGPEGPMGGGDNQVRSIPKAPRKRRRKAGVNPSHLGLIRVDHAALVRGWVEGDEVCHIAGLGAVPVPVARRLLGDAVVRLVLTKGVDVANVTSLGRAPTAAQRVALLWAGTECSRLGCHRPAMEFDHRKPFARDRVTHIHNIDGLCKVCHRLKTHHGWALLHGTGKREMVPPTDPRHPGNPTFHTKPKRKAA